MSRSFRLICFVIISFCSWGIISPPQPVFACTPPPGGLPDLTIAARVADAPIVLEGTVTDVFEYFGFQPNQLVAVVQVAHYYKGHGPALITIEGFGDPARCYQHINVGGPYIFYLEQDQSGNFSAHYTSQFDAYVRANDESRAEVRAATGREPTIPDLEAEPAMSALQTAEYLATNVIYDAPPTSASAVARTATVIANATDTQLALLSLTDGPDIFFDPTATLQEFEFEATQTHQALLTPSAIIDDDLSIYRQTMTADAVQSQTAQAQLTASSLPPSPTFTPSLEQLPSSSGDSDDSDFIPFLLGFLAATALFVTLFVAYSIGQRNREDDKTT